MQARRERKREVARNKRQENSKIHAKRNKMLQQCGGKELRAGAKEGGQLAVNVKLKQCCVEVKNVKALCGMAAREEARERYWKLGVAGRPRSCTKIFNE